jgi:hypothetical protein
MGGAEVFGITELLEQILLDEAVDFKTLLLSQRVSKDFESTIIGSTSLQQKLYFKPIPGNGDAEPIDNPLLFIPDNDVYFYVGGQAQDTTIEINRTEKRELAFQCHSGLSLGITRPSPTPSWTKMLLTQRPQKEWYTVSGWRYRWREELEEDQKFGSVCEEIADEHERRFFAEPPILPKGNARLSAATRVLQTPKLLHMILNRVDPKTLLRSPRISTHFQSVIESSIDLLQKLFFKPETRTPLSKTWSISSVFNPFILNRRIRSATNGESFEAYMFWVGSNGRSRDRYREPMIGIDEETCTWNECDLGVSDARSWGRMFITQPPGLFRMRVHTHDQDCEGCEDGVVMEAHQVRNLEKHF